MAPARKLEYEPASAMRSAQKIGVATVFGALLSLAVLAPTLARADRARSFATDVFSVDLPRPVCFAVPVSLRDAASCKGLPPAGANDFDTTQVGLIAAGGIRRAAGEPAAAGSLPILGLVQVFQIAAVNRVQPDSTEAERVGLDATKAILATLPSEARRSKVTTRIETVEGVVQVRTAVDVDDLAEGTRASFFGHIETSTIFGREATYTVVWSGPAGEASATALAHLADEATKTMRVVPSQRPEPRDSGAASGVLGKALLPLGGLAAFGALGAALYVRKRRGKGQRLRAELWPAHGE
jgi:hypothetical protein